MDIVPTRSGLTSPCPVAIEVLAGLHRLPGVLDVPPGATSLVLFALGGGSDRHHLRNQYLASALGHAGVATLLFDLLTEAEAADRRSAVDAELLASRLVAATAWAGEHVLPGPVGYLGSGTGAAGALLAAADLGPAVSAVVARDALPDLVPDRLHAITAPTLLIVGEKDRTVHELNRQVAARLTGCRHQLVLVPGADHRFEEPGALEVVAHLVTGWFTDVFSDAQPD